MAALGATTLAPALAQPQAFPSRTITWVVPFTPGGVTDTTSRALAKKMGEILGQQIVIDNRPGAGGSLGTEQVARAAPDGYTILYITSGTMAANLFLYEGLKYEPLKDFIPVHGMFLSPLLLVVSQDSPFNSVSDLVAKAKAEPGKLNHGSAGVGTGTHLVAGLFQEAAGIKILHIPYKGTAPALQDMLGGRVDLMFDYTGAVLSQIKTGKVRPLAVMSDKRLEAIPDVPTIVEAGYPGAQLSGWSGIGVPAGTPPEVVEKLADAMRGALRDEETVSYFVGAGSRALVDVDEPAFRKLIVDEQKKWGELVRKLGATLK
ncbi:MULTISPECIES: tripartite tricarboxylate transporter substrate binding protein [unclassified Variovorax]|uniref:Bug family tripartite tricarboxylate transporter substrate binding protein n=1 Tax=unclassified Variovorax TaxID=663243 RepID=UPI000838D219|nr:MULTISPECIES: tripartite tricarboxylate transporter substrate binding protein [unclassified Variovorax]